jgi:hypothetical protein
MVVLESWCSHDKVGRQSLSKEISYCSAFINKLLGSTTILYPDRYSQELKILQSSDGTRLELTRPHKDLQLFQRLW